MNDDLGRCKRLTWCLLTRVQATDRLLLFIVHTSLSLFDCCCSVCKDQVCFAELLYFFYPELERENNIELVIIFFKMPFGVRNKAGNQEILLSRHVSYGKFVRTPSDIVHQEFAPNTRACV